MKMPWWRVTASAFSAFLLIGITAPAGQASGCGPTRVVKCTADGGGATVGMTQQELERSRQGLDIATGAADTHSYEYTLSLIHI